MNILDILKVVGLYGYILVEDACSRKIEGPIQVNDITYEKLCIWSENKKVFKISPYYDSTINKNVLKILLDRLEN